MKRRLVSSIFSSLLGDSGHLIRMSIRSRKLTRIEWLSFLSSFFLSISLAEYSLLIPYAKFHFNINLNLNSKYLGLQGLDYGVIIINGHSEHAVCFLNGGRGLWCSTSFYSFICVELHIVHGRNGHGANLSYIFST